MIHIVLVEPQIPPNTGSIGRLCVALGATLHLVHPLGFRIDEKSLRRAGMDYWEDLQLKEWDSLADFLAAHPLSPHHFLATTKAEQSHFDVRFESGCFLLFGREDAGLPESLLIQQPQTCIKIPQKAEARSLNLAVSAGVIAYEAYRQISGNHA